MGSSGGTSGGGSSVAGSDTQVQFNDGGALGANAGLIYDKTARSLTVAPSADAKGVEVSGQSLTGTAAQPGVSVGATWNTTGTPDLISANLTDTASNAAANLLNLKRGGVSQVKIRKDGFVLIGTTAANNPGQLDVNNVTSDGNGWALGFRISGNGGALPNARLYDVASNKIAHLGYNGSGLYLRVGTITGDTSNATLKGALISDTVLNIDGSSIGLNSVGSPTVGFASVAAGISKWTDGGANLGWNQWAGESYLAADGTNATTTMANTGLSVTVKSGRKYGFKCILFVEESVAGDGIKIDFDGGSAAATDFRAHITLFDTGLTLTTQVTALATDAAAPTVTGAAYIEIHGSFEPSGNGTFIPRYAQNAHTAGTLTLRRGSHLLVWDMP